MACRIETKRYIEDKIMADVADLETVNMEFARKEIKRVNDAFRENVVSVHEGANDYTNKITIHVPERLVDKYHAYFIRLEQKEAALVQQKDALRAGENYSSNYLFQKTSTEGQIVSEKTIRDLAARLADRIGIPVIFESDRRKQYKGKILNDTVYINLVYATLDTSIHEILGHPIITTLRGTQLYKNLLKELEYGVGKEVFNRIKANYDIKDVEDINVKTPLPDFSNHGVSLSDYADSLVQAGYTLNEAVEDLKKNFINSDGEWFYFNREFTWSPEFKEDMPPVHKTTVKDILKHVQSTNESPRVTYYSFEEQQEEALVELLGLMTANKLNSVKDGKLISLLKRLLKEVKQFVKSLLDQKELEIDKLPDNLTLEDLSSILAYSNSKLILPGYEVEYTTPDNIKFKTYQEASNHISNLIKNIKDVDLSKISVTPELSAENQEKINEIELEIQILRNYLNGDEYQAEKFKNLKEQSDRLYELEHKEVKFYTQETYLKLEDKLKFGFNDYEYVRTESTYSRGNEYFKDILGKDYKGYYIHGYNTRGAQETKVIPITKEQAEEIWKTDPYGKLEVQDEQEIYRIKDRIEKIKTDGVIKFKISDLQQALNKIKLGDNSILGFISRNKEYEQSKEIIDEWKKVNNIEYNPEEVYSRGQGFYSVVGAYSDFDVNLLFQNLLQHIEDNEKSGGEFTISAFTKPINKILSHIEGVGGKVKFEIYPSSKDIKWASNTDVFSGSVWDASEKVSKDKASELLGVSYTKSPALTNVETIQPNLAYAIDHLQHIHNELGISITGNNFRLIYDDNVPFSTKKIVDSINKILDQKYGKLVKPDIKLNKQLEYLIESSNPYDGTSIMRNLKFNTKEEAEEWIKIQKTKDYSEEFIYTIIQRPVAIQPSQTNETLKENINTVKSKLGIYSEEDIYNSSSTNEELINIIYAESSEEEKDLVNKGYLRTGRLSDEGFPEYGLFKNKSREYTSQALINMKIAVLKNVAKKYPRSLIRSEVKSTDEARINYMGEDTLPFQKVNKKQETPTSKASSQTLVKIKEAAKKMGIDIQKLFDYLKANPIIKANGINGLADLIRGVVAVAEGREDVALTEEIVHIATAILEQTNPKLITELISKIDRFKIYNQTLEAYKNNKDYQLNNGKPDIRKIKKEAVDKLLAEVIINQSEGSTQFPELLQEENILMIQKWWNTILDYVKGVYRKTNIDIFNVAGETIINQEIGTVKDIKQTGVFYQQQNDSVDAFYNKVINIDSRMELNPESPTDKRHYTFDGIRVLKSITEKIKEEAKDIFGKISAAQQLIYDQYRDWGTEGHSLIENYVSVNLIDKDGYKKPFTDVAISSNLDPKIQEQIKAFVRELISSYKEGTRFVVERKVINEKEKGGLASTLDFLAIEPDDKTGIKVDVLDWKFTKIDDSNNEDVSWFKQKEWKTQMGEYSKIMYQYGIKPEQLRKTRMIPFILNYKTTKGKQDNLIFTPLSIEIGKLDNLKETTLYLLPVALDSESTGKTKVNNLLEALRAQWEKLYSTPVNAPSDKLSKDIQMNQMSKAIRFLHMNLNFEPLVNVGDTFLKSARKAFDELAGIDYTKLSQEEIQNKLKKLIEYSESAQKFIDLDTVFLSVYPKETLTKDQEKILASLEHISAMTDRMLKKINQLQTQYVIQLGIMTGSDLEIEETEDGQQLKAEVAIGGFAKTFLEGSKLSAMLIKMGSYLIKRSMQLVNLKVANEIDRYGKLLIPLEEEARRLGKSAFSMIATMTDEGLNLIHKLDSKFYDAVTEARKTKNREFILNNIDKDKYNTLVKEILVKGEKTLDDTKFSSDETKDIEERISRKKKLRDSLDIVGRETFNGYDGYHFNQLLPQVLLEEGHLSTNYIEMSKSKAALDVWEFFTEKNKKARDMGYIGSMQGSSFFPLIEATTLEKFAQNSNTSAQMKDFFTDFYTVRIDEEQQYSKLDKETGKVRKNLPKYFTRTNKSVEQLSKDLNKVGALWIKSLLQYENAKNLEYTLLTLHSVETTKGSLITDSNGDIIEENGKPKVDLHNNKNAGIMEIIINDFLYGLTEDPSSMGNLTTGNIIGKFTQDKEKTAERVVSVKKAMKNMDSLVRWLGVGLKPLIGLANWAGGQFQSYINSGNMYKFWEFTKNNFKISTGVGLTTEEKALLDLINPLNEDVATEKRRRLAAKVSYLDYISTWTFTDVMMVTNSFPERKLQFANAMSFNENSMIVDGRIVNIRQYLKKQDRETKKSISEGERKALEKSYESRVAELKETSSLLKVVQLTEEGAVLPGVSQEALADYRLKVTEYQRLLNGQMSTDDKAGYRRDTIFSSFMMFKTWIPKLVSVRALDINKNLESEEWEYGRTRLFLKTWVGLCNWNIKKMNDIITGNDEGLKLIDEMLEAKKAEYYKKEGKTLTITNEEFYDLVRTQIDNQIKELKLLIGIMGILIASKVAQPPEDATDLEKNHYKFLAKAINKIADEVTFYYNPATASAITSGNIFPALSIGIKVTQFINAFGKEIVGHISGDEKMIKSAYPVKYFVNIIPGAAQFQSEILPYISPELAKELGVRVTVQSRRQ